MTPLRHRAWLLIAVLLCLPAIALSEVRRDAERELELIRGGGDVERAIPGAEYRIAVFSYEDPHGTGLGDALAGLVARRILAESHVGSIGVIRYEGGLTPHEPGAPSYFDAVDILAATQDVTLSVWGIVRAVGGELQVQTFLQIPEPRLEEHFRWNLRLPASMGDGELTARLRPDRISVQELVLPRSAGRDILSAVDGLNVVRAAPSPDADIVRTLPMDSVYRVLDRDGEWIKVSAGPGWVSAGGQCPRECGRITAAADFAAELLRYMEFGELPARLPDLSPTVDSVIAQVAALEELEGRGSRRKWSSSIETLREQLHHGDGRVSPSGAAFDNIIAMVTVANELHREFNRLSETDETLDAGELFNRVSLDRDEMRSLAVNLARASLDDPRNPDVLHNLSVLFEYAGDSERAALAAEIARHSRPSDEVNPGAIRQ